MKNETRKTKTTVETHRMTLDRGDLVKFLQHAGYEVPSDASCHVSIPGGGDWSNIDLEINADVPLVVSWEITKTE